MKGSYVDRLPFHVYPACSPRVCMCSMTYLYGILQATSSFMWASVQEPLSYSIQEETSTALGPWSDSQESTGGNVWRQIYSLIMKVVRGTLTCDRKLCLRASTQRMIDCIAHNALLWNDQSFHSMAACILTNLLPATMGCTLICPNADADLLSMCSGRGSQRSTT